MRSDQLVQRHTLILVGSLVTILAFMLAACGNSGTTSTGSAPVTPTTVVNTNGCPSSTVVGTAPSPANVVLTQSNHNTTITAHVGDVIEVDLPFGQSWSGPTTSQGELQLQTPAGFALTTSHKCVWRFTAQGAGTTVLNFYGKAICKQGELCPQYIMNLLYTIVVK
jgi:hypothetical protein